MLSSHYRLAAWCEIYLTEMRSLDYFLDSTAELVLMLDSVTDHSTGSILIGIKLASNLHTGQLLTQSIRLELCYSARSVH